MLEVLSKFSNVIDSEFYKFDSKTFENCFEYRIWKSWNVDYESMIEGFALLSYHKNLDPTSFDDWKFLDYQMWFKKMNEIGDNENKKRTEEQENSTNMQNESMNSAKRKMKAPKASMPKMRMPKI